MRSPKDSAPAELVSSIRGRIRGKTAIVAIGNILRGDDGLGPKFVEIFKEKKAKCALFDCGTAPENYIFPILSTGCDTVVLIDAADTSSPPGGIKVFGLNEITNVSFSTHNPSPRLFTDLLKTGRPDLNIFVVSVQPRNVSLGESISKEVLASLDLLTEIFYKALS